MKLIGLLFGMIIKAISLVVILVIVLTCLYIGYKGNQPMSVPQVPQDMTYFEFVQDRIAAAKELKLTCGVGMFASLAILGPFYSVLYTYVAVQPDSFIARVTAPDPDIDRSAAGASWTEIPDVWWDTVERLSWTMLKPSSIGCKFRPVNPVE
jgi:hypothetical protein